MAMLLKFAVNACASCAWNDGTILVAEHAKKPPKMTIIANPWDTWYDLLGTDSHNGTITCLACPSNDRSLFVSGSLEGLIHVWQRSEGSSIAIDRPTATWWDGNSYSLYDDYVRLDKTSHGDPSFHASISQTLNAHTKPVTAVSWSAGGGIIVSGSADNTVYVWSAATGQELYKLKGCHGIPRCIATSANGSLIAVGCEKEVKLWSSASGSHHSDGDQGPVSSHDSPRQHKLLRTSKVHDGEVTCVAVSTCGACVASGSTGKALHLWSSSSGRTVHTLQHDGQVDAVAMSAGNTFIVSTCATGKLCIWDRETGKQLESLACKGLSGAQLAISDDGSIIGTVSQDHFARVWAWLAAPEPKALRRSAQLAAWEGNPKHLLSRINVLGAEGVGKTSLIRAMAGQGRQNNLPAVHQTTDIDITYYKVDQVEIEASTFTPITRDTEGHHLFVWQKALEDKLVQLRNKGRVMAEVDAEALSRRSVTPEGKRSWSPLNLGRRKHGTGGNTPPELEDAKDTSHHHFKHLRAWMDHRRSTSPEPAANEPVVVNEVEKGPFDIPELDNVMPQLHTAEVDAAVHDRLKHITALLRGRAVMYDFGCFPGHASLYPLFINQKMAYLGCQYHVIVFNMQELQPGEADGQRTIHGKIQTVAQWREQCIAHLKSWVALLDKCVKENIFLVGTHRDLVSRQDDHRAIHKILYTEFQGRFALNTKEELCFFPVDTTVGPEDQFLRHLCHRTAWRQQCIAVKSLRLLTAFDRMQKPLITLKEALTVAKEHVDMDIDATQTTLSTLHHAGLLMWLPDINDGSHIVLDLPWFIARIVPALKESKATGTPLGPLLDKMTDIPADQMSFFHSFAKGQAA